jgi:hypothetical protein
VSGLGISSIFTEDATYTKIREVAFTYRLAQDVLDRVPGLNRFSSVGVNLTGRNLFTWSDYRGYDPETGSDGGDTGSAAIARVDGYRYPNFRTYSASLEFIF